MSVCLCLSLSLIRGTRYDAYDLLATVEANWNLGDLGRNDAKGKVFKGLTPQSEQHAAPISVDRGVL